jgi:hypothetical protein
MNLNNLKIGVLFTAYNCGNYINDCLTPWFNLKNNYNFKFAINSGMFKMYKDLGFIDRNSETLNILYKYRFDYLINTKDSVLLDEDTSRNNCLNYLKDIQGCDLIWLVDADEIYTESQIINTINFIRQNNDPDWYSILLRNFTFTDKYHLDFDRPNIYWTDRNNGIDRFHFDCHVLYKDGALYHEKNGLCIPKNILFIDHYSWLTNDTRSPEKIEYQKSRHHGEKDTRCSYVYKDGELFFNKNFYEKTRVNYPFLHEFLNVVDNRFILGYDYFDKRFYIIPSEEINNVNLKIYNSDKNIIFDRICDVRNPLKYWFVIDLQGSFKLEIYVDNKLTHEENFYINIKMMNYD